MIYTLVIRKEYIWIYLNFETIMTAGNFAATRIKRVRFAE